MQLVSLKQAGSWLSVTRPLVALRVALTAAAAAYLAGATPTGTALAALSGALIAAGIYTLDDLFDARADEINHPERPAVSGALSTTSLRAGGLSCLTAGVVAAWFAHQSAGLFALAFGLGALAEQRYSLLQRLWATRGLALTLLVVGTLALGALTTGRIPLRVWALALALGVPHFGGRVLSDLPDAPGDRAQGLRTLPVVSPQRSVRLVVHMLRLAALTLPLPALAGFGPVYLATAVAIAAYLFAFAIAIQRGKTRGLHRLLNWVMAGIMVAAVADDMVMRWARAAP